MGIWPKPNNKFLHCNLRARILYFYTFNCTNVFTLRLENEDRCENPCILKNEIHNFIGKFTSLSVLLFNMDGLVGKITFKFFK